MNLTLMQTIVRAARRLWWTRSWVWAHRSSAWESVFVASMVALAAMGARRRRRQARAGLRQNQKRWREVGEVLKRTF